MTRRLVGVLGLAAGTVALAVALLVPPRAASTARAEWAAGEAATVRGAYHVHTVRSDGSGTVNDVARAAGRAGLDFVILTDHGDGTRPPDPPRYVNGVLIVDGVEISTTGGHYVALGMDKAPYPLAGAPDAVVEDVRRLGGLGIAAHPGSPKPGLGWADWRVPADAIEWLNADSEWRDEAWPVLARALATYPFRAPETLAALLDRPADILARWDALGARRRMPALAAADAHARFGFGRQADPDTSAWHVPLPGYEASFRAFANRVQLRRPWTGEPAADARALLDAIGEGRIYTVIDALASPGALRLTATNGHAEVSMGEWLASSATTRLRARVSGPPGTVLTLLRNGQAVAQATGASLEVDVSGQPGVYRVEARVAGQRGRSPIPWIVSNPIYIGVAADRPEPGLDTTVSPVDPLDLTDARAEAGRACTSAVSPPDAGGRVRWRWALAPGAPAGQFAAVRFAVPGLAAAEAVQMRLTADRPARLWLQVRAGRATERWGTTFYVDGTERDVVLPLSRLLAIGPTSSPRLPVDRVDSLLVVADTLNTRPGTSGSATIHRVALVRHGDAAGPR